MSPTYETILLESVNHREMYVQIAS